MRKPWIALVGLAGLLITGLITASITLVGLPMLFAGAIGGQPATTDTTSITCTIDGQQTSLTFTTPATGPARNLTPRQQSLVTTIVAVTTKYRMGTQAAVIAVMTAAQESDLGANPTTTTPNSDGDAGPFQQRVLPGWYGTLDQVNNDTYAATAFLRGVTISYAGPHSAGGPGYHLPGLADIPQWQTMAPTAAAQAVQRSAFPWAYATHEPMARAAVAAAGGAADATGAGCTTTPGTSTATGDVKAYSDYMRSQGFTPGDRSLVVDPFGFYYGECTGYAVWAVRSHSDFKDFRNDWRGAHFGNANHWAIAARQAGLKVSARPSVGDIAQTTRFANGHVAYVSAVHTDGTFDVVEANWASRHTMGMRTHLRAGVDFENFIQVRTS